MQLARATSAASRSFARVKKSEPDPRRVTSGHSWLAGGAAVLVSVLLLLPGLGAAPLDDPGEGQHAEIAREVSAAGGWVTLRLNGVRYFDKPPLHRAAGLLRLRDLPGERVDQRQRS